MQLNRRSILQSLGAFFAAPFGKLDPFRTPGLPKSPLFSSLSIAADQIMLLKDRETKSIQGRAWVPYGPYSFLWTGWKSNAYSVDLAAQWVAAPITKFGSFDPSRQAFYVSCPGRAGFLGTGEAMDCRSRPFSQFEALDELGAANWPETLKKTERVMLVHLLEWVAANGEPKWDKMTPETKFFTNSLRHFEEVHQKEMAFLTTDIQKMSDFRREYLGLGPLA